MNDFWNREVLRVKYFKHRFEIREEESKQLKAKKDQDLSEEVSNPKVVNTIFDRDNILSFFKM